MTNQTELEIGFRELVAPRGFVFKPEYDASFIDTKIYQNAPKPPLTGDEDYVSVRKITAEKDGVTLHYAIELVTSKNALAGKTASELDKLVGEALEKGTGFCESIQIEVLKEKQGTSVMGVFQIIRDIEVTPSERTTSEEVFIAHAFNRSDMGIQIEEDKPYDKQHILYRVNRVLYNIANGLHPVDSEVAL